MFKASFKKKNKVAEGEDDDSDWESVEEDFPHVKLSELLDGLTLEVNGNDDDAEDEEEMAGRQVQFAPEEEKKQ